MQNDQTFFAYFDEPKSLRMANDRIVKKRSENLLLILRKDQVC